MAILPIILTGDTLGQRHRNLNALVDHAYNSDANFQEIQSIPEQSPVDRLFKIDLASKFRDIDYVMKNLKDDDMLYVSRALKCRWILENEYLNIMNPEYLEQHLYPNMITTAVSKMKCWLSINLKDPDRCEEFYQYYFERNFDLAIRFLTKCQVSYILNEMPKLLEKVDPFYFKVFCEKSPQVAKMFFNSLTTNEKVLNVYLENEVEYYNSLKVVLKADSDIFFNITEKYFNIDRFNRLSSVATKYIMGNFKERFLRKPELYAARVLNMKVLAECLTVEECKDVTLKLARAEYLSRWFTYKNVEPLIKRLPLEERSAFKNKVFVEKNVGEIVKECQYEMPSRPRKEDDTYLFDDITHSPSMYNCDFRKKLMKRKCGKYMCNDMISVCRKRTVLDQFFDEFRFMSFEKTLFELRKRIAVESSPQNRQFMMLVLVSKTGGRDKSVASLLKLLERHQNEPPQIKATIVRSLVKRAYVWRLPQDSWEALMTFAVGLGLDGKTSEANCREGLHAVVLRNLLGSGCIEPSIFSAFIGEFSTLKEYSLTTFEEKAVTERLPALMLASIVNENDTNKQANLFNLLFQILDDYKLPIDTCPVVPALAALASRHLDAARNLLLRLFHHKKARRELFEHNFACVSTDASYLNALRHSTDVLKKDEYVKRALNIDTRRERFFQKLAIYFTEVSGLAELYLSAVKESLSNKHDVKLARPFTFLIGSNLESHLKQFEGNEEKAEKRFVAALKANAHLAKPKLNIETFGYHAIGPKAVANVVVVCRNVDVDSYLAILLKWPRALRLALILSERLKMEAQTYESIVSIRPNLALKSGIRYFSRNPNAFNQRVWEVIKPVMKKFVFESTTKSHFTRRLQEVRKIPESIRADYCTILYTEAKKKSDPAAASILCHIENLLPKVNNEFVEDVLSQFLQSDFSLTQVLEDKDRKIRETCLYLRILVKFLLLSKSEETQKKRYEKYAEPLFKMMNTSDTEFNEYFEEIVETLRYNAVFFDKEYISCMPVFEGFVSWMHTICPMDTCFKYYGEVHLTMLFFKSVRQCLKHRPDIFEDNKDKFKKGVDILGKTFGTYIAKEVDELKSRYFESIVELYENVLVSYLNHYFNYDPLKEKFIINIIRGIVDYGKETTPLLSVYLFREICYLKDSEDFKEIKANLNKKQNKEIQFFLESTAFI